MSLELGVRGLEAVAWKMEAKLARVDLRLTMSVLNYKIFILKFDFWFQNLSILILGF